MLAKMNVPVKSEVGLMAANDRSNSWRWQKGMGLGFRCDIPHVPYTSRHDYLLEGVCGDDC